MSKVAVELINIDEDLAEKAVQKTIDALAVIVQPIKKSIEIEPHDDVRGIWAKFDIKDTITPSSSYNKALVAAVKSLILMQESINSKVNVHVTVYDDKGDNE